MEDPTTLAMLLADAAFEAWQDVQDRSDRQDDVGMGADGTPTSLADRMVEDAILNVAGGLGLSVWSEEAGFIDHGSELIAVVDPLDGTRNAGRGIPFFCTSVAIGRSGLNDLEAGVVQNFATGDIFSATRGLGAQFNGKPVQRRPFDPNNIVVGVIADASDREIEHAQTHEGHHLRDLGAAALEMCLVGTGALDAFVVRKPWLRVVDLAAGALFVREAGGIVINPDTGDDLASGYNVTERMPVLAAHSTDALEAVR